VAVFLLCGLLCLGALCAAPFGLDIQAGDQIRLRARYLWFCGNLTDRLRRMAAASGLFHLLRRYAPVFRKPLRVKRLRVKLDFSTGDAAETAVLYGWLCGLFSSLLPRPVRGRPEIALGPSFSSRREWSLDCDISLGMPAALFFFRMISVSIGYKRRSHV
jgi:hypothetical protein